MSRAPISTVDAAGNLSKSELEQFIAARERLISTNGWMVMTIAPHSLCTNYSIGLHDKELPELFAIGLPPEVGHDLVNDIGQMLVEHKATGSNSALIGEVKPKLWHRPFVLIPVDQAMGSKVAVGAASRSSNRASYLQIVHADRSGYFPWDSRCSATFRGSQPVLAKIH